MQLEHQNYLLKKYEAHLQQLISDKTKRFMKANWFSDNSINDQSVSKKDIKAIRDRSSIKLKINFNENKMLSEAKKIQHLFVNHRKDPSYGWKSICLHGMSFKQTENFKEYGYEERPVEKFHWTEISTLCPYTTYFFKNLFPYSHYFRVRYMMLEPGGFISPHNDLGGERGFAAINMSLNQPDGCFMIMENFGIVPWQPGEARLLDIGLNHSVVNFSDENRYHIIVHGYADETKKQDYSAVL